MEDKRDTKIQILDLAETLIKTKGYFGFSYRDIATQLNIRNAAIHYYFPGKEDLELAVIEREISRFRKWKDAIDHKVSCAGRLEGFIGIYRHHLNNRSAACLVGASATVFSILPARLREKARELATALLSYLKALLDEGRETGEFQFSGSTGARASLITASLAGGLQLAQVQGEAFFHTIASEIISDLTHSNQ
ncbi:TetR/AcrR family transcriptional regulator [Roseivirga sp. BDSF3-8]|uniref:TetR/AcrR family transcriptional regulator n=1 Tax=Roseivirga sp. BDSF3-8 TaxID=3241598 RepID=UPI0035327A13